MINSLNQRSTSTMWILHGSNNEDLLKYSYRKNRNKTAIITFWNEVVLCWKMFVCEKNVFPFDNSAMLWGETRHQFEYCSALVASQEHLGKLHLQACPLLPRLQPLPTVLCGWLDVPMNNPKVANNTPSSLFLVLWLQRLHELMRPSIPASPIWQGKGWHRPSVRLQSIDTYLASSLYRKLLFLMWLGCCLSLRDRIATQFSCLTRWRKYTTAS